MERIASRKLHVAPLARQAKAIDGLIRAGRFPNATAFLRAAIDHYLSSLERRPLAQQAREMAVEWQARRDSGLESTQAASMATDEEW
jgi:Arc/MetJ-type ribon-helix-helix transcriptional regulator